MKGSMGLGKTRMRVDERVDERNDERNDQRVDENLMRVSSHVVLASRWLATIIHFTEVETVQTLAFLFLEYPLQFVTGISHQLSSFSFKSSFRGAS